MKNRTQDMWVAEYKRKDALWLHDGNPKRPHALLASKLHSTGFFNSELVMEDPYLLDGAVSDLLVRLEGADFDFETVDRVVGPAMGAITLAHDLARHITMKGDRLCLRAYVEKGDGDTMDFKRTKIRPNERVLLCEDVLTTGGSVEKATQTVALAGGIVLPFVAVIVNRSYLDDVDGKKIIALIRKPMPMWEMSDCPLCAVGSVAIQAKSKENWERLNAKY